MKKLQKLIPLFLIILFLSAGNHVLSAETKSKENEIEFQKLLNSEDGMKKVAMLQWLLWQTGYFDPSPITGKLNDETKTALQKYQKQRGLPVRGKFDVKTFEKIMKDFEILMPDPVSVSSYFFSKDMWNSHFSARGTWVFESSNEKMAHPIQMTEIKCYRNKKLCFEATANIADDILDVTSEIYDVERWDDYEIVTKPYDYECVRYVLRINRQQRSVKKLRTTISSKDICKKVDQGDRYIRLINGFDEWWEFKSEFNENRGKIFSPSLKKQIEKITE